MGALPKKKRTRSRIGHRRTAYRLYVPQLGACPQCRSPRRPHRVCGVCGYYNGREVIAKEEAGQATGG
ncbi:MAG: 50S ribosomal protein L32 [Chloroflexota bacterium]|nr:50S ribosomal protein L32 [Chloroflexota bacterium]MDE2941067.1 50S ribosomal protein L32 [Chloroflexota bacterium]MDE3267407.1 50S ribosomal protein L32 [Chloroflexota bacterium]